MVQKTNSLQLAKTAYDFKLEEVLLSVERISDKPIDITDLIPELQIYESVDSRFLSGFMAVSDSIGLLDDIGFVGTEKVNIKISLLPSTKEDVPTTINRNFIIAGIDAINKGETLDTYSLQIIEDTGYINYLENVNQPFLGTGEEIIKQVVDGFFERTVEELSGDKSNTKPLKFISPNMHPFEIIDWVRSLMIREFGFPFYVYTTLSSENIKINDLLTMLSKPTVNAKNDFNYSAAGSTSDKLDINQQSYVINSVNFNENVNTLNKIRMGHVGSSNQHVDLLYNSSSREILHFDVYEMFKNIKRFGGIKETQSYISYDNKSEVKSKSLHDYNSRTISGIKIGNTYDGALNTSDVVPIHQQVNARAMKSWLGENIITIEVPGKRFMATEDEKPIELGDTISINFLSPKATANPENAEDALRDNKKSGEHIVLAIKHLFTTDKYIATVECAKITDIENSGEKLKNE